MRIAFGLAVGTMLLAGLALAAGPFDGTWKGTVSQVGAGRGVACPEGILTATIADGKMTGTHVSGKYTFQFRGTVQPDGTLAGGMMANVYPLTGKFAGSDFTGSYQSKECSSPREVKLHRG